MIANKIIKSDLAALLDHALQPDIVPFFGDAYPLKAAAFCLERFGHGIDAVDVIHRLQCIAAKPSFACRRGRGRMLD